MSEHHLYSPSDAPQLMRCVGSHFLESAIPDRAGDDANDGTASHTWAGMALQAWIEAGDAALEVPIASYLGATLEIDGVVYTCDDERVEYIKTYTDLVTEKVRSYILRGAVKVELRVEQKLPVHLATGIDGQFGTGDAVIIAHWADQTITIEVIDLKYGRGVVVYAEENEQLMLYGVAVVAELELVADIRDVILTICQPRVPHQDAWETTSARLLGFALEYAEVVRHSDKIHARGRVEAQDLVPGDKQCRFCRAKARCPALTLMVEKATLADFQDLTQVRLPAIDDTDLHLKMAKVDLIEGWCKAIRGEVEARLLASEPVEGWKLVAGRKGARAWRNPEDAEKRLKSMRLRDDEMYDFKLISPTTAEKLAKSGTIGPRQWPALQELIHQPEGKPSVAPASDKRPAISVAAAPEEFDSLV